MELVKIFGSMPSGCGRVKTLADALTGTTRKKCHVHPDSCTALRFVGSEAATGGQLRIALSGDAAISHGTLRSLTVVLFHSDFIRWTRFNPYKIGFFWTRQRHCACEIPWAINHEVWNKKMYILVSSLSVSGR